MQYFDKDSSNKPVSSNSNLFLIQISYLYGIPLYHHFNFDNWDVILMQMNEKNVYKYVKISSWNFLLVPFYNCVDLE